MYSIQFEVQKEHWLAIKRNITYVFSSLAAWQIAKMKKATENESHPWSKSCPNGELLPVLLACLPSIASNVEYKKMQSAAK